MSSRGLALALALAGMGACEDQGGRTPTPDQRAAEPEVPLDPSPGGCAECHAELVEQWQGSLHARAWDDPVFRAEYDLAPRSWCRSCHDPPARAPDSHGVDCATCHVRDGRVLALRSSPAGEAAHPLEIDPELGSPDRCGTCHQFMFEDDGVHDPNEALQDTVEEWRASNAAQAGRDCVSCHMPSSELDGARVHGHGFPGMADAELLARAVGIELEPRRTSRGIEVDVRLRGRDIGHAFPTGDVFRRARLILRGDDGSEAKLDMQRWLARTADPDGRDSHVRTLDDTRVPPPGQGVLEETLVLDSTEAETIAWTLELHRLPLARARARGLDDELTRVVVARGRLDLAQPAADGVY